MLTWATKWKYDIYDRMRRAKIKGTHRVQLLFGKISGPDRLDNPVTIKVVNCRIETKEVKRTKNQVQIQDDKSQELTSKVP